MIKKTPLASIHEALGGKMIDFLGWHMPVQYTTGILAEHRAVRQSMGIFDLSHMGEFRVKGVAAESFLQNLVTNDVRKLTNGQALYTPFCQENGGIIDDILVYKISPQDFLCVVNAANIDKDWQWFQEIAPKVGLELENQSPQTALLAVQGPRALGFLRGMVSFPLDQVPYYHFVFGQCAGIGGLISRTGYTGEDGVELFVQANEAKALWGKLAEAGNGQGLIPCGLGCRDTLRLEAGMRLYGNDMDETVNPLEAGLGWTVKWDKGPFIGSQALARVKEKGPRRRTIGVTSEGAGVPRHGFRVLHHGIDVGSVLSGTFSPTLKKNIALLLVRADLAGAGHGLEINIRGQLARTEKIRLPFYKRQKQMTVTTLP